MKTHNANYLVESMMFKIYTRGTPQEIGEVTSDEYIGKFLATEHRKLILLDHLIPFINNRRYTNILSLGAGTCVIEYLLSYSLPVGSSVVATDIDMTCINHAKKQFPNIRSERFDFYTDSIKELNQKFDLAYFMGSAYVMNDEQYISLLKQLKESGVKHIIDFQPAYVSYYNLPREILGELKHKLFKQYRGRFHGYQRTLGHMRQIYKKANLVIEKETFIKKYTNNLPYYIAELRC